MNREERRKSGKNEKPETVYSFTISQLKSMIAQETEKALLDIKKDAIYRAATSTIAAFIMAMHDTMGFGPQRIHKILDKVNYTLSCVEAETVSLDDLINWCEEYGIELRQSHLKRGA